MEKQREENGRSLRKRIVNILVHVFLAVLAVIWVEWLHISKLIAPVFNLLLSVPINFLLHKF